MLRYAELLLIAAEAAVEIGDNISALTYMNRVRARARMGGTTLVAGVSTTVAPSAEPAALPMNYMVTANDVLEERRLELAFEGKRWYDIARRQLGATAFGATGLEGAKSDFSSTDYLMPLPADELDRNPNLLPQNPGY